MENTPENISTLETRLRPCNTCGLIEKLDVYTVGDEIVCAYAYCDRHTQTPGKYTRGNYVRIIYNRGASAAACG